MDKKIYYDTSKQGTIVNIDVPLNPKQRKSNMFLLLGLGLLIGFINGFFGGGGGMICVPVLTLVLCLRDKVAHATTLLIMLPLSICSFVVYILYSTIDFYSSLPISIGFVIGGVIGALILKKINNKVLGFVFSGIIFIAGIKLLV